TLVHQRAGSHDIKGPNGSGLANVECFAAGADFDAAGPGFRFENAVHLAGAVDAPDLPRVRASGQRGIGISDPKNSVGAEGKTVRTVHPGLVGEDTYLLAGRVDFQHIVTAGISDIHLAGSIEDNAFAEALDGRIHPHLGLAVRRDPADGAFIPETHRIDVAV